MNSAPASESLLPLPTSLFPPPDAPLPTSGVKPAPRSLPLFVTFSSLAAARFPCTLRTPPLLAFPPFFSFPPPPSNSDPALPTADHASPPAKDPAPSSPLSAPSNDAPSSPTAAASHPIAAPLSCSASSASPALPRRSSPSSDSAPPSIDSGAPPGSDPRAVPCREKLDARPSRVCSSPPLRSPDPSAVQPDAPPQLPPHTSSARPMSLFVAASHPSTVRALPASVCSEAVEGLRLGLGLWENHRGSLCWLLSLFPGTAEPTFSPGHP
eukprot:3243528-Rhodomonas_salina.1